MSLIIIKLKYYSKLVKIKKIIVKRISEKNYEPILELVFTTFSALGAKR